MDTNSLLVNVVLILASLLILVIIFYAFKLLDNLRRNSKHAVIREWANDAYAYAEAHGRELIGSEKAKKAYKYLEEKAKEKGWTLSAEQIEAAVQLAWNRWEGIAKASAPVVTVNTPLADAEKLSETLTKKFKEDVSKTLGP